MRSGHYSLSYKLLNEQGPQQWPFVAGDVTGKARLYTDGVFQKPDGKAQFINTVYKGTPIKRMRAIHCICSPGACATSGTA